MTAIFGALLDAFAGKAVDLFFGEISWVFPASCLFALGLLNMGFDRIRGIFMGKADRIRRARHLDSANNAAPQEPAAANAAFIFEDCDDITVDSNRVRGFKAVLHARRSTNISAKDNDLRPD
ncbi:hypothetical protein [Arthrobacter sp. UYCu712]|uniref:hypothetical protein n=1 Tax=Arthrobacter sp. UYCu712 TaxID=3156340 RepID=UPI0033963668